MQIERPKRQMKKYAHKWINPDGLIDVLSVVHAIDKQRFWHRRRHLSIAFDSREHGHFISIWFPLGRSKFMHVFAVCWCDFLLFFSLLPFFAYENTWYLLIHCTLSYQLICFTKCFTLAVYNWANRPTGPHRINHLRLKIETMMWKIPCSIITCRDAGQRTNEWRWRAIWKWQQNSIRFSFFRFSLWWSEKCKKNSRKLLYDRVKLVRSTCAVEGFEKRPQKKRIKIQSVLCVRAPEGDFPFQYFHHSIGRS